MHASRKIGGLTAGLFYKFVNSKSCCRSSVGTLKGPDGKVAVSDQEKADLLNSYFGSVCTVDDGSVGRTSTLNHACLPTVTFPM